MIKALENSIRPMNGATCAIADYAFLTQGDLSWGDFHKLGLKTIKSLEAPKEAQDILMKIWLIKGSNNQEIIDKNLELKPAELTIEKILEVPAVRKI